jgi:hypothetical protein
MAKKRHGAWQGPKKEPNVIGRSELVRLQFCNSADMPAKINIDGQLKEWVGIGWIEIGPPDRRHPTLVEDEELPLRRQPQTLKKRRTDRAKERKRAKQ